MQPNYALYAEFASALNESKIICTSETTMYRVMREKQYSAVASNAKVLMKLVGLEAKKN